MQDARGARKLRQFEIEQEQEAPDQSKIEAALAVLASSNLSLDDLLNQLATAWIHRHQ